MHLHRNKQLLGEKHPGEFYTEKIDRPLQHNGIRVPVREVCWAMGAHPGLTLPYFLEEVISTLGSEGWVEPSQRKGRLRSLLEEGTMAVQQLRKGRVNSPERLECLVRETRQKKSTWLPLGENLLFLVRKVNHWQADHVGPKHTT